MPSSLQQRALPGLGAVCLTLLLAASSSLAQQPSPANTPVTVPAGAIPAQPDALPIAPEMPFTLSDAQHRQAEDAYLRGARRVAHKNVQLHDLEAAQQDFQQAASIDPANRTYALAVIVTREQRLTQLVQLAARARLRGDDAHANALLDQARQLDPHNPVVAQHFSAASAEPLANEPPPAPPARFSMDPMRFPAADIASTLSGAIELQPTTVRRSFHLNAVGGALLRDVYSAYGIQAALDPSANGDRPVQMDIDNVGFDDAIRIATTLTHTFAVPIDPTHVLLLKDTTDNRNQYLPQVEETVYLPGVPADEMAELANLARNVFDLRSVTANATGGDILLRGDPETLKVLNATYASMVVGSTDVLFDVNLYEVSRTTDNNVGATLPSSAGVFSIAAEAQTLVNSNQSLINQAVAAGLINLNGTPLQNLLTEVEFLIGSGSVTASQYTNLLGIFGGGLTYAGLYLGSNSSFSLLLNSSEVRLLDSVQLRSSSGQDATFRVGSRYPIVTATYTAGTSSSLASQLSGLNINGTSVSSLLAKYLGSSSQTTVPQIQYEDLGLTLKLSPQVQHSGDVELKLEMKIEALGSGSLNGIPVLNNRSLSSTVTVPEGQTALLASLVNTSETKALEGLPGLSELPGFQGTEQDRAHSTDELLITITPHLVRPAALHVVARTLAIPHGLPPQ